MSIKKLPKYVFLYEITAGSNYLCHQAEALCYALSRLVSYQNADRLIVFVSEKSNRNCSLQKIEKGGINV